MKPCTVLIVEDDPLLQENLTIYLQSKGYRLLNARSVQEARNILQKETPDIIFLDLLLPDVQGSVLLKEVREGGSSTPILIVTNTDSQGRKAECLKLGATEYIIKSNTSLTEIARLIATHCVVPSAKS